MQLENTYANYVDDEGAAQIQALEKELGMRVMAYATPSVPGDLSAEQLKSVEELEIKLCVRLVAYKKH
ncbi:MAG: hypothetical protein QNK27_02005 [Desulfuromusa sp.]|nr:hypothetical protein [Desulfuromusa sp.]